jgi:hypothetical protein
MSDIAQNDSIASGSSAINVIMEDQKSCNKDLNAVSPSEFIWLWRQRQISRKNKKGSRVIQEEAAQRLGVKLPERDISMLLERIGLENMICPSISEKCALARRRSGIGLLPLSGMLDMSRVTFLRHEYSGSDTLVEFWREKGFIF